MHPIRQRRVSRELRNAKALSLKLGNGAIINTLAFNGMPALLFEAEGKHIVKCLPLNQIGVGNTPDEAFNVLGIDLVDALKEALAEKTLEDVVRDMLIGRAAPMYWDVYMQLAKKPAEPKSIKRYIENLELTTDTYIDPALFEKYRNLPVSAAAANG